MGVQYCTTAMFFKCDNKLFWVKFSWVDDNDVLCIMVFCHGCFFPAIIYCIKGTVRCRYSVISFLKNSHERHPIAHLLGRDTGCLLWLQTLIYILPQSVQRSLQYHVLCGCVITAHHCIDSWKPGPLFTKKTPSYWYIGISIINLRWSSIFHIFISVGGSYWHNVVSFFFPLCIQLIYSCC